MSLSPTSRQVILTEVFDEASVPTDEEIYDYAFKIGIDVENEPHLLYLARDGLMQALPPGWKPCFDKDKKEIYYFNFKTKQAQWEHPLDEVYRNLVKKARAESITCSDQVDDDSRTSLKEDLKSFEEASLILPVSEMNPKLKKLEPLGPLEKGALKKAPATLNFVAKLGLKESCKFTSIPKSHFHTNEENLMQKTKTEDSPKKLAYDETEVRKRPNSSDIRNRRNIGPMEFRHLSKQEIIAPLEKLSFLSETKRLGESKASESPSAECGVVAKDEGYVTEFSVSSLGEKEGGGKKELTLTGGGSVFLKSNKIKSSPSSDLATSSFSKEELSDGLLSPDMRKSEVESHPKGILREQNHLKSNERVSTGVDKKIRKEDSEDERKSVRFNLEKELKVTFEIPQSTSSESDENISSKKNMSVKPLRATKEETRLNEVDFEDLHIDLGDEKLEKEKEKEEEEEEEEDEDEEEEEKKIAPKKFKPSQTLVKEFRQIFENHSKTQINFVKRPEEKQQMEVNSSQAVSIAEPFSSRNSPSQQSKLSSPNKPKEEDNLIDLSESKDSGPGSPRKSKSHTLDSAFNSLVGLAMKSNQTLNSEVGEKEIKYRDKDYLLEEILKESESESFGESEDDKVADPQEELAYLEKLESQINEKYLKRKEMEENLEKLKHEKANELQQRHRTWSEDLERAYEMKKKETEESLKTIYEVWIKEKEKEMEKVQHQKSQKRLKELKEELEKKEEEEVERVLSELESDQKERLKKFKREIEDQEKKELAEVKKGFEESLNEKKLGLMRKHKEDIQKIERNLEDLLSEQKAQKLKELELARENEAVIEVMRLEMKESYQKQKNNLMKEHEFLLENLRQEHALAVEHLKIELKNQEESLKKTHMNRLDEIKMRIEATEGRKAENVETPRSDVAETRVFEKVRCEKRLLEDKYKTLKEKYIRLKTEAKSTLERKKKNKEAAAAAAAAAATGSETERSSSYKTKEESPQSVTRKLEADKKHKLKKHINNLDYLYQNVSTEDEENLMSPKNLPQFLKPAEGKQMKNEERREKLKEESSGEEKKTEGGETKKKRQLFSRFKAASTSRINISNKTQGKESLSPVESLRRQLKKLEELEDQFPVTTHTDTYMRYPFTDNPQFGSSEIEFFKHRIHLERESVRRAKDSLKTQKKSFENRQRELKQKLVEGEPGTKNLIDQIYQEEKELTDMEVSVHRTRALLGEKIIRLRHLEQSLKRISQPMKKESFTVKSKDLLGRLGVRTQNKEDDRTLSDLSSYSGSSGFSSTDFNETHNAVAGGKKTSSLEQNRRHFQNNMQESSEIIQSLENLNSEIREIWEVLKKQHQSGQETITMLPPPPLIYGELGWPAFTLSPPLPFRNTVITSTSNLQRPIAQQFKTQVTTGTSNMGHVSTIIDSTLIDRTRSLRDWLKAARTSSAPSDVISPSQVTL